jgi:hypothetical protein
MMLRFGGTPFRLGAKFGGFSMGIYFVRRAGVGVRPLRQASSSRCIEA